MNYRNRLQAVLDKLGDNSLDNSVDGYIQPRGDAFQGEYVPASAERLSWLTGFDGSAGYVGVTAGKSCVFVDGRYTLQVHAQIDNTLYDVALYTQTPPAKWMAEILQSGMRCGIDPKLFTLHDIKQMKTYLDKKDITLVYLDENPIDAAWDDRPIDPVKPYRVYPNELAGQSSKDKRERLAAQLKAQKCNASFIAPPDSVAWLLNIRGSDLNQSPLPLTHAILHDDASVDFFCDAAKVTDELKAHLGSEIRIAPFDSLPEVLSKMTGRMLVDPKSVSSWVGEYIKCSYVDGLDMCSWPKACKNDVEIDGMKQAHITDGIAVTQFLHWLDTKALSEGASEVSAQEKLHDFRSQSPEFLEPSFDTISGFGANGAIVHYRVTPETNLKFSSGNLYLCDSGGQYLNGTTDITRTVAIGEPSDEMRENFTHVLRGHIGVALAKFPKGTNGTSIDAFARAPLWEAGLDFAHGTGHGVGAYLHVHEGPASISPRSVRPLKAGLILSNEPGYYKENEYGIRIESLVVVGDCGVGSDGLSFLSFETITMAPLDKKLIVKDMLTPSELDWLNTYHANVYEALKDKLPNECKDWFKEACAAL